jgi:hypothetical protein
MPYKYFIGKLGFTSKSATLNYTRNMIREIGYRKIYNGDTHYQFLYDLLQNHTEKEDKIGVGIDHFEIMRHHIFKQPYWIIHHIDGTFIDASYNHCCEFKERPTAYLLNSAMRYAVKEMTINYKTSQSILICNICSNSTLEYHDYHTDHIIPFVELHTQFMKDNTLPIPSIFNDSAHDIACFRPEDNEFETKWVIFHNTNATLQILCSSCNLKKGKKFTVSSCPI